LAKLCFSLLGPTTLQCRSNGSAEKGKVIDAEFGDGPLLVDSHSERSEHPFHTLAAMADPAHSRSAARLAFYGNFVMAFRASFFFEIDPEG